MKSPVGTEGLYTAAYWRARAEEARTRADGMHDVDAVMTMLRIAETYERMAERAEVRAAPPSA